ncbi:MAG: hypothetical protein H0T63_09500 [Pyrinomonadaceae bacterium]|nr:hypothetical protein [Pyrinomonadaceae bacterium]MDQ3584867.1 hypothetical protein [Acidobacteriota bacterium]
MSVPEVARQFKNLEERLSPDEYNFNHFRTAHLVGDVKRTIAGEGIKPGELAPDFEMPLARGGTLRLSSLRGKPVLLHFGSIS